jgi:integrase
MSLWKRGEWYWADFSVNGLRYRVPLRDSKGRKISADEAHREMAARSEERAMEKAERGQLAPQKERSARLPFTQAADEYLASRKLELAASSMVKENDLAARLKEYFKGTRLSAIKTGSLIAYREWRAKNGVGPALINMEMGSLRRILKRAKLWHMVGMDIRPLKEPETIGRALTFEEKTRLFHVAGQRPEWETACWAATVAVSTTARGCELRALQWRNVDFINRTLEIPKSKTDAGVRLVPLTKEAYDALLMLRRRAEMFGLVEPSHFVFAAFRSKFRFENRKGARGGTPEEMEVSGFDPTRPMRSWRTAWRTLTRAVECPKCKRLQRPTELCKNPKCKADMRGIKSPVAGLRFHDLRHTSISALGEAGVPDRVIMDIAGHVSMRMLKRYSHIQLEAKRAAIQALSNRPQIVNSAVVPEGADVTKHVTKSGETGGRGSLPAEVIESIGRPVGTRTPDLYRVKVAL